VLFLYRYVFYLYIVYFQPLPQSSRCLSRRVESSCNSAYPILVLHIRIYITQLKETGKERLIKKQNRTKDKATGINSFKRVKIVADLLLRRF